MLISYIALRPQLQSIYRYGSYSDCERKWQDFKWCTDNLKTSSDDKRKMWIERRAKWWTERRLNKSSEDVWSLRDDVRIEKDWPSHNNNNGSNKNVYS